MPDEPLAPPSSDSPDELPGKKPKKGPVGGQRPGAGRPKTRTKYAGAVRAAERQITARLPQVVDAEIELALGVTVQETDAESGRVRVYTKPPDHRAASYLIDRILGKPTERQELSGPHGGPVPMKQDVDDLRKLEPGELVQLYREAIGARPEDR
jgi:hypothetical protein